MGVLEYNGQPASVDGIVLDSSFNIPQIDIKYLDFDAYSTVPFEFDADGSIYKWFNRGFLKETYSYLDASEGVGTNPGYYVFSGVERIDMANTPSIDASTEIYFEARIRNKTNPLAAALLWSASYASFKGFLIFLYNDTYTVNENRLFFRLWDEGGGQLTMQTDASLNPSSEFIKVELWYDGTGLPAGVTVKIDDVSANISTFSDTLSTDVSTGISSTIGQLRSSAATAGLFDLGEMEVAYDGVTIFKTQCANDGLTCTDLSGFGNDGVIDLNGTSSGDFFKTVGGAFGTQNTTYDANNRGIWVDGSTSKGLILNDSADVGSSWTFNEQSTYFVVTCTSTNQLYNTIGSGPVGTQLRLVTDVSAKAQSFIPLTTLPYPETNGAVNTYKSIWEYHTGIDEQKWILNGDASAAFQNDNNLNRVGAWTDSQYPFWGYIHQIIGYSAFHNEGRRQQIRDQLKQKWGISHF